MSDLDFQVAPPSSERVQPFATALDRPGTLKLAKRIGSPPPLGIVVKQTSFAGTPSRSRVAQTFIPGLNFGRTGGSGPGRGALLPAHESGSSPGGLGALMPLRSVGGRLPGLGRVSLAEESPMPMGVPKGLVTPVRVGASPAMGFRAAEVALD